MTNTYSFFDTKGRERSFDLPKYPVADVHAHLSMLEEPTRAAQALANAAFAGVALVCNVADPTEDARDPHEYLEALTRCQEEAAQLIDQRLQQGEALPQATAHLAEHDRLPAHVKLIAGCHPHNAQRFDTTAREKLAVLLEDPCTVALGEIGLDFHYDHSPRDVQLSVFAEQLKHAKELNLPAVFHLREAHDVAYELVQDIGLPKRGAMLHCFTLDAAEILRWTDLGCVVSVGGAVTFNKLGDLREAVIAAPQHTLMTETDAPFMAPIPLRGTQSEPAMSLITAYAIDELRTGGTQAFLEEAYTLACETFSR